MTDNYVEVQVCPKCANPWKNGQKKCPNCDEESKPVWGKKDFKTGEVTIRTPIIKL